MLIQAPFKRTTVDIDTRRTIVVLARVRKPHEVAEINHETFIRNALKDKLGWPRREQAPESIKVAAKEMAAHLVARDKAVADAKAKARNEQAACDALVAQEMAEVDAVQESIAVTVAIIAAADVITLLAAG